MKPLWFLLLVSLLGQLGCDTIRRLFPAEHERRAAKAIPIQTNQLVEGTIAARSTRVHSFALEKSAAVRIFVTGAYHPDLWLYRANDDELVADFGFYRQKKRGFDASLEKRLEPGEYHVVTDGYPNEGTRYYMLVIVEEPESGAAVGPPLKVGETWVGRIECKGTPSRNAVSAKVVFTIKNVDGQRVESDAQLWATAEPGLFTLRGVWVAAENRLILMPTQWIKHVHRDWFGISVTLDETGKQLKGRIIGAQAAETYLVKRPCADVVLHREP